MERSVDESAYQYGLSNLHAQIGFMESILHIAYRLPLRRWSAHKKEEKELLKNTKKRIQKELKVKLGINVQIGKLLMTSILQEDFFEILTLFRT